MLKTTCHYIFFFVLLLCNVSSLAADWQLAKESDGIEVFLRDKEGSDIQEFKGVATINASVDTLVGIFDDLEACPEWLHQCTDPKQINYLNFNERYNYQGSNFPFPADDREVILHVTIEQNPATKSVRINLEADATYCEQNKTLKECQSIDKSKRVRIKSLAGFFNFEVLTESTTRVTWQQHADPVGSLPNWLVNALLVDIPFNSLQGLIEMSEKPKYKNLKLNYGPDGKAIGIKATGY